VPIHGRLRNVGEPRAQSAGRDHPSTGERVDDAEPDRVHEQFDDVHAHDGLTPDTVSHH
jgi:hypothetical protein